MAMDIAIWHLSMSSSYTCTLKTKISSYVQYLASLEAMKQIFVSLVRASFWAHISLRIIITRAYVQG